MGFKEKIKEYEDRKEAQKFFRENNEAFLNPTQYIQLILICLGIAIAGGFIHSLIIYKIGINFTIIELAIAYAITEGIKKIAKYPRMNITIIGMCAFIFALIMSIVFRYCFVFGFNLLLMPNIYLVACRGLLSGNLVEWIYIGVGLYIIYYLTH